MESKSGGRQGQQEEEGEIVIVEVPEACKPSAQPDHDDHDNRIAASDNNNVISDNNNNSINKRNEIKPDLPTYNLNPRWSGYGLLALLSIICLGSVAHVKNNTSKSQADVAFGSLSLAITVLVLLHEYIQHCISRFEQHCKSRGVESGFHDAQLFDFKVLLGGKVEGLVLALLMLLWIIGLGYLTQVNGIAYNAGSMNVYWSTWLSFATCLYTFIDWIITILSKASMERKSTATTWFILALSSLVVMGTCIEMFMTQEQSVMIHDDRYKDEGAFGISWGLLSFLSCIVWIGLVAWLDDNVPRTTPAAATSSPKKWSKREWMELILILVCLLGWIVGAALLTRPQGLGATIMGQYIATSSNTAATTANAEGTLTRGGGAIIGLPGARVRQLQSLTRNPTTPTGVISIGDDPTNNDPTTTNHDATTAADLFSTDMFYKMPGSNLYLGVWISFGASLYLFYQWIVEPPEQPQHEQPQQQP